MLIVFAIEKLLIQEVKSHALITIIREFLFSKKHIMFGQLNRM